MTNWLTVRQTDSPTFNKNSYVTPNLPYAHIKNGFHSWTVTFFGTHQNSLSQGLLDMRLDFDMHFDFDRLLSSFLWQKIVLNDNMSLLLYRHCFTNTLLSITWQSVNCRPMLNLLLRPRCLWFRHVFFVAVIPSTKICVDSLGIITNSDNYVVHPVSYRSVCCGKERVE